MSFTFNRTNNKIVKKTVSLATNPSINTNVFEETYQIISATNSTITLPNTSNNNSNYYNNWYIRILSGLGINQIRQIQSYNSSTKQITLKTNLDIIPSSSDSIILYNKLNSNIIWQESNNRFAPVYIKNSSNLNQIGETIEYLDFGCNNLTILSNKQSHSTTSGSLIVNGGSGITGSVNIGNSLNVTNNINCNSLSVNGVSITGNSSNVYLTNIVPGTAQASKALVLNSTSDITGINSLTTTTLVTTNLTLNGTAITASASEINKLAGITTITSDFNKLASITATATELNYLDFITGSPGIAEASKALVLNSTSDITGINSLTTTTLVTTNLTLNGTAITASASEINKLAGITTITSDFNKLASITATATELNYLDFITGSPGIAEASKALVLNSTSDITGINSLTTTTLVTTNLTLNGTAITASASEINKLAGTTAVTSDFNKLASITATATELNYTDITTIGTAEASKALIVDSSRNIININSLTATNLTATNLTGTIQTASQTNITSVGTLTSLTSSGNIVSSNANSSFRILPHSDNIVYLQAGLNTTTGSSADIFIGNYAQATSASSRKIIIKADGKVGFGTTSPSYTLDVSGDINLTGSLRFSGTAITASATELNKLSGTTAITSDFNKLASITASATELNYLDFTTGSPGIAEASKSLVLNSTLDITGINSLTTTTLITTNLTLNGIAVTASATKLNYNDITTIGTAEASKALILDSSRNISNINSISLNGFNDVITLTNLGSGNRTNIRFINDARSWELGSRGSTNSNANSFYLYDNTASAYRLIVNSSGSVNIVNHNGSSTGLQLNGTLITSTAAELNVLDGITATTTELNILDGVTATTAELNILDGVTATTAELNILDGVTATTAELNILDGVTATTAELNILDGVTATTAELNFLDITSAGTALASKALILDSSRYINGINKIVFNVASTTRQVSSAGDYRCIDTNTITFNNAVTAASGTDTAHQVSNFIGRHTITATNTNVTTTTFSTFYIQGEPLNGTNMTITNKYALFINSGNSYLSGNINIAGHNGSSTGLQLNGTLVTATAAELNILDGVTATTAELNYLDITSTGTAQASKALVLDSSSNITGINNISLTGTLTIGTVGSGPNRINFSGTTLDSNTNHTVIAERIYGGTEQSELLIFKGNDPASTSGPDRIRLRASEFRFQTYTSAEDFSVLNDNNDRLYIANNGNIGIGTTSPGNLLEVNGRISMTNNGYGYSHFSGNGGELNTYVTSSLTGIGSYTNTDFGIYTGGFGNMRMRIYTNGNAYFTNYVGIGQSSPNWPLDVNMFLNTSLSNSSGERFTSTSYTGYNYNNTAWGNVSAKFSNDIVSAGFIAISDKRLKTNIENINDQYCLDFIKYIQPKSYNMKIDLDNNINNTKFGFIAQDLIKYGFNNMVTYIDENNSEYESYKYLIEDQESPEHIKLSVSYNDIIPILTRNIQIISNEKKILEEKINILENENNQLKDQINNILLRLQNLENNN